jgi:hypothetical protein
MNQVVGLIDLPQRLSSQRWGWVKWKTMESQLICLLLPDAAASQDRDGFYSFSLGPLA